MAQLTTKSIALYLLGEESSISRSEFVKMAESVLWSVTTADLIFYELEKEYIRISEDMYIKAKSILESFCKDYYKRKKVIKNLTEKGKVKIVLKLIYIL